MLSSPMLEARDLRKTYTSHTGLLRTLLRNSGEHPDVRALDRVTLTIAAGEILGLVGASGSGKTTTGMLLALLERPTAGRILLEGANVTDLRGDALRAFRRRVQVVFQDPYQSLDPRYTVLDTVREPLDVHHIGASRSERTERAVEALHTVELRPAGLFASRYPHELSGGQRQRVSIARAIVLRPAFLVLDEPVSMLDISVRAGVLNLLLRLREEMRLGSLFITHDLSVARYICDRIAVMHAGQVVEEGSTEEVIHAPRHDYTRLLLSAVPGAAAIRHPTRARV